MVNERDMLRDLWKMMTRENKMLIDAIRRMINQM